MRSFYGLIHPQTSNKRFKNRQKYLNRQTSNNRLKNRHKNNLEISHRHRYMNKTRQNSICKIISPPLARVWRLASQANCPVGRFSSAALKKVYTVTLVLPKSASRRWVLNVLISDVYLTSTSLLVKELSLLVIALWSILNIARLKRTVWNYVGPDPPLYLTLSCLQ